MSDLCQTLSSTPETTSLIITIVINPNSRPVKKNALFERAMRLRVQMWSQNVWAFLDSPPTEPDQADYHPRIIQHIQYIS